MNKKELQAKWKELTGCVFEKGKVPTNAVLLEMIQDVEDNGYFPETSTEETGPAVTTINEEKVVETPPEPVKPAKKSRSEDLPKNLKCIKNKNGFFIETIGQGWVKLTKGQVLKLAELIKD